MESGLIGSHAVQVEDIGQFLTDYPGMSLAPILTEGILVLAGRFEFRATLHDRDTAQCVSDAFDLKVEVPPSYPRELPAVQEIGGRVPKTPSYHVNGDGTLCLGSPLRLLKLQADRPGLVSFAETCIVPYLFRVSIKLANGGGMFGGELAHGTPGVIADYVELFQLHELAAVPKAITLLAKRKRVANKFPCPCGCRRRLGRCPLHNRLNQYRRAASRSWFARHARELGF